MVYTGTEIAPGRAKFAGYTPIHGIHRHRGQPSEPSAKLRFPFSPFAEFLRVGQADAQGASCQAATRPLSLESLWSEQKELKVKGLESLWSEQKELKELKVKGLESLWSEQKGAMCCAHQEE